VIWEGVFPTFQSIPKASLTSHAPDEWVEKSLARAESVKKSIDLDWLSNFSASPAELFLAISRLLRTKDTAVVTEVGGNLGQLWHFTKRWVEPTRLQWQIVEKPELLEHPQAKGYLDDDVTWADSLSALTVSPDILYFGSSLQYIEHLSDEVIPHVVEHRPDWIVVSDGMVGDNIPTFCTWQHYYDHGFPSKFRSLADITKQFSDAGYLLVICSPSLSSDNAKYYPSDGLPAGYQLNYPLNLVFQRSASYGGS
jgi:putative methyltransferase (TIGR04325 family)